MDQSIKSAAEIFFSSDEMHPRYLFGCNDHSAALASVVDVQGFIDDFHAGSTYCGKPVVSGEQAPNNAMVVNCVLMARSITARERVRTLDVASRLDYADLLACVPAATPVPNFVGDTLNDQNASSEKWEWLKTILEDEQSKRVLRDVSRFRRTGDQKFLAGYSFCPAEQYFDSVCPLAKDDVFVDCGGFDGDTTEQFVRRCPDYKRVWLFEPAKKNLGKAKARLRGLRDINFIPKGVSDKIEVLGFDASAGSASAITESGSAVIDVTTLDLEVVEPVSFIKMDLEGWELNALSGARHHIKADHPRLAVAVYHRASDFWKIPEFILGIRNDYKVHLRHYTEGWIETVMYFVPR